MGRTVHLLVGAALADEGKRISVHLADQNELLLILVLSHAAAEPETGVLARLAGVPGTSTCGTEAGPEGRRVWALLDTAPPRPGDPASEPPKNPLVKHSAPC
ncbi:hypothetical protein [Streptomyces sp. NBC_00454]|uniref:hypothetical protein n=1 Tax=Streptomyces sp. NBC_00454 TaxID=2975747 RepID=UPI0030E17580